MHCVSVLSNLHQIFGTWLCRDLVPFSHESVTEVRRWCWVIKPGWGQDSVQTSQVLPHQTGKTVSLWGWLSALSCWNSKRLSTNVWSTLLSKIWIYNLKLKISLWGWIFQSSEGSDLCPLNHEHPVKTRLGAELQCLFIPKKVENCLVFVLPI